MPAIDRANALFIGFHQFAEANPGIMSRGGISVTASCRTMLAMYFRSIAKRIQAPVHDQSLLPEVHGLITKYSPVLASILKHHIARAYQLGFAQSVVQESETDTTGAEDLLPAWAILDKLGTTGQAAADYAALYSGELIKGIDETTRKIVADIIAQGIEDQLGTDAIVKLLRSKFVDMAKYRAVSIAVTEMNDAISAATLAKIESVGLEYKKWIISPGACPICTANSAQGAIPLSDTFQSGHERPPAHPGKCRCALVGVRKEVVEA